MKLGVSISWRGATIGASWHIASEADRVGFDYLWITEAWGLEALSTAGYLLGITPRIKIGVGVLNVFSRSAALIGMGCATLNQIASGRFILGLGTSAKAVVENWHGEKFSKPTERTREYVEVVRRVTRGDQIEFRGEVLKLSGFRLYTIPRRTKQEIYVGAMGDRNLEMAGAVADGAIVTMYPLSKLTNAFEVMTRTKSSLNEEKKLFAYLPIKIVEDSRDLEKARLESAKNIAFYVASMGKYYAKNLTALGFGKSVERIISAHSAGGSQEATKAVGDELMDELSIVGTLDLVKERLARIPKCVIPIVTVDVSNPENARDLNLEAFQPILEDA